MFIFSYSLFNLPAVQFAGFSESQGACDLVRDRGERPRSAMLIYKNCFTPKKCDKQTKLSQQSRKMIFFKRIQTSIVSIKTT